MNPMSLDRGFAAVARLVSRAAGRPLAFILASSAIILWGLTGPIFKFSDTWQLVVNTATTIITFLMVFVIQNSQNRDAAAMQAKLDEIIRAVSDARNEFIGVEHRTDKELEKLLDDLEAEFGTKAPETVTHQGLRIRLLD
jgi:low affinity Fe/Cu permease